MSRARDVAYAVASIAFGATWTFAAVAKIASPLPAYEFLARAMPPGAVAKAAFVVGVTVETLLGGAMALRAIGPVRGFVASLALLAAASSVLVYVRATDNGKLPCGCYGTALKMSIDGELWSNAAMATVLAALVVWGALGRKKPV